MKSKFSYFMFLFVFSVMLPGQSSSIAQGEKLNSNISVNTSNPDKASVVPVIKQEQNQSQNVSSVGTYYVDISNCGDDSYNSFSLNDNAAAANLIKNNIPAVNSLSEGTMDNEGNWWTIAREAGGFSLLQKIDRTTGNILYSFPMAVPGNALYTGVAFNPIDKLIYILLNNDPLPGAPGFKSFKKNAKIQKDFSSSVLKKQGNADPTSTLFTFNPLSPALVEYREFPGSLNGLAISNEGVIYSVDWDGLNSPIVEFDKVTPFTHNVGNGSDIPGDFVSSGYIDMEFDRNTNKCYMLSQNDENFGNTELREVNLSGGVNRGTTSLVRGFNTSECIKGLAFDYTPPVVVPVTGNLCIVIPDGSTHWYTSLFYTINWRVTSGIILGSIGLEYTTNGGTKWLPIASFPISIGCFFPWLIPDGINSTNCMVRIVSYCTRKVLATSKVFSITPLSIYSEVKNYPNPFNPSTKITFNLANKSNTSLKVFNSLGQQVADLFNGDLEAGNHEFEFNASNLPSGVYFYNLKVDNNSIVNKMLLVK